MEEVNEKVVGQLIFRTVDRLGDASNLIKTLKLLTTRRPYNIQLRSDRENKTESESNRNNPAFNEKCLTAGDFVKMNNIRSSLLIYKKAYYFIQNTKLSEISILIDI